MSEAPDLSFEAPFDEAWFEAVTDGFDQTEQAQMQRAVQWVRDPLRGECAITGEPLAWHAAAVALILVGLGSDAATRISAVLATVRDEALFDPTPKKDPLVKMFGAEVATMVHGARALLRLGYIAGQNASSSKAEADQKEKQRKMVLAMAADLRIVMLRLASRLQSLRWYASSKRPCPPGFARETMTVFTPLANRLGIWQVKWEMEDLAFRFLEPDTYKEIARQLEDKRVEREALINRVVHDLGQALDAAGIRAEVSGRPKHIYSIWNKMRNKSLKFSQLFDLRALRVIVEDERDCYGVLAQVHAMWTPVSDEFDDYIARPKPNGYRSLHTVVSDHEGKTFEIQIRTREMHEFAEYGMAAHWRYKEAGRKGGTQVASGDYERKVTWMRQLLAWGGSGSGQAVKNLFDDRIYVMTPQARVIELPAGATPVDFAYYLHTDLG
ncbi:MAG: HD domain-containing protein, partial [Pusillimonas sp.]